MGKTNQPISTESSSQGSGGESSIEARYKGEEYDKLHLNANQTKVRWARQAHVQVVLVSGATRLGETLGSMMATGQGVAYWDSPLKVARW